jgi:hypothetical protein
MRSLYVSSEILFIMDHIANNKKDVKQKGTVLFESYNLFCQISKLNQKYIPNIKEFYAKFENLKIDGIDGVNKTTVNGGGIGFSLNYNQIRESLIKKNYIEESSEIEFIDDKKINALDF